MDVTNIIGTVLDRERGVRDLSNDKALARFLGITPKTISQWRNGRQLPKAVRILIPLVVAHIDALTRKPPR